MPDHNQLKVRFGIFLLSRRVYFTLWVLGLAVWIGIAIGFINLMTPGTVWGDMIRHDLPWIDTAAPWVFWGVIGAESVEAVFALWRFRKREAFVRREGLSVDDVGQA